MKFNELSGEKERSNVYLDKEPKKIIQERDDGNVSESARRGVREDAYGEQVVKAERKNDAARKSLESAISAFKRVEREFSNIPSVAEQLKEERISLTHGVVRTNYERWKTAESVDESDPEERVDESDLERLEEQTIQQGGRVFPDHGKVQKIAPPGVTGEEIVELLRERNPNVSEEQFEEGPRDATPELESVASARTDGGERR